MHLKFDYLYLKQCTFQACIPSVIFNRLQINLAQRNVMISREMTSSEKLKFQIVNIH